MNRQERRKNKWKKIRQRIELVRNKWKNCLKPLDDFLPPDGYFSNIDEINKWMGAGRKKKTKTKDGHASYRHNGSYGEAIDYSPHDKRQVDDFEEQLKEV